eukprot:6180718-Pleurochrysis_carterae.AAC.1
MEHISDRQGQAVADCGQAEIATQRALVQQNYRSQLSAHLQRWSNTINDVSLSGKLHVLRKSSDDHGFLQGKGPVATEATPL